MTFKNRVVHWVIALLLLPCLMAAECRTNVTVDPNVEKVLDDEGVPNDRFDPGTQ